MKKLGTITFTLSQDKKGLAIKSDIDLKLKGSIVPVVLDGILESSAAVIAQLAEEFMPKAELAKLKGEVH